LGLIGDPGATTRLLDALQRYSDGQTFNAVLAALAKIRDPQSVNRLCVFLVMSRDKGVRKSLIEALGTMKLAEAVPGLCDLIHDEDIAIRAAIIQALGDIQHPSAIPALVTMLQDNERLKAAGLLAVGPRISYLASEALKVIGTREAEEAVEAWKQSGGRKGFWPFRKS
ncbi:MAG: HEAT repeat domain-containing protein, partial [Anaerolineae bacterium]|nr:HEAT repeat domain-containing protein [Anaerolineae bacterium]